jgi:hypothetical protein
MRQPQLVPTGNHHSRNSMPSKPGSFSLRILVVLFSLALLSAFVSSAYAQTGTSLGGSVTTGGSALAGAHIALFHASSSGAARLAETTTGADGKFALSYTPPASGVLYIEARPAETGPLRLLSVVAALGNGGALAPWTNTNVTLNELTTVATTYAFAQFFKGDDISGVSPGLENAAATVANLANPETGEAGTVITDANNGSNNDSYAILNTLANLVSLCATGGDPCSQFLTLATTPSGTASENTVQAVIVLAKNPTVALSALFTLSQSASVYSPALAAAPQSWILALLYTDENLYASGRIAFDARGNVWTSNNWQPGTLNGSNNINVLDPTGKPIFGSPIFGGGMDGGAWGAAIAQDGSAWFGSFGGNTINKYASDGTPLSPDAGWTDGGITKPQGIAVDQVGNVWIANNDTSEPQGVGSITVYPLGDPSKAFQITGGGLNHPFAIQFDNQGRAWVSTAGIGAPTPQEGPFETKEGAAGGNVIVINPDYSFAEFSPIATDDLQWPLGLALDSKGNAWVAGFFNNSVVEFSPDGEILRTIPFPVPGTVWGIAVDGGDRVWVAGFADPTVWLICGENTAACPPGSQTGDLLSPPGGFRSKAIQHLTSLQVDPSGNVWLSNNWSQLDPPTGGVGIVEFIGVAAPVCAPLMGLPVVPSAGTSCPGSHPLSVPMTGAPAEQAALTQVLLLGTLALSLVALSILLFALSLRRNRAS